MKEFSFHSVRDAYERRKEPEGLRRFAYIYWAILIITAVLAICTSVGYGMWQFFYVPSETIQGAANTSITGFNKEQLTAIVEALQKQQENFGALQGDR